MIDVQPASSETPPSAHRSILAPLKALFRVLESFGRAVNRVVGKILVFLVYFLAVGPLSILIRISGKSVLEPTPPAPTGSLWLPRTHSEGDPLTLARRQF